MQIVSRRVLVDFFLIFTISLVVAAALMLFVGAMLDLPQDVGASEIVLMLPYLVPEAIRNAMQAAGLFAACAVFGRMAGSNELLALSSLGVSPFKVISPVLVVAVLLSLSCVWLYDIGESWGQVGVHQVLVDSAESIAYRFLRTKRTYTKGPVTLNVKGVEGRRLIRPMLIMETPDNPQPVTVAAEEGELCTSEIDRSLSIVLRNGTVYIGDTASFVFPDAMEQTVPLGDGNRAKAWPPEHRSLAGLRHDIRQQRAAIGRLEHAPLWSPKNVPAALHPPKAAAITRELAVEREHLNWLETQVNRRWANGFFCLAFIAIGIPVSMRIRSRDYLTSFFACFLPVVLINHPLHNFCIKLAESGRAAAWLPWGGDVLLVAVGGWMLHRSLRH